MGRLIIGDFSMKKKKKKNNNRFIIIIIILLLLFSYYEINSDLRLGGILRDMIFIPLKKDYSKELHYLLNEEIKKENEELKSLLNINTSLTDFTIVNASIVERNVNYWLEELTIDKGYDDGIENGLIVINNNGLIGKVLSTSKNTSIIKLISGFNSPLLVTINNIEKVLIIDNYSLFIKGINENENIGIGDKVITSGLMNKFPNGILIGEIEKISKEKDDVGFIAKVKLSSDINNLRFVSILKRKL